MNWFQRHLNWGLFFGSSLLPLVVSMIFWAILFAVFWGQLAPFMGSGMDGLSEEVFTSIFLKWWPLIIIAGVVSLALSVFAFIVVWWYLGQKARSKWFLLLVIGPGVLAGIFEEASMIIRLPIALVTLVCVIALYRLENHRIGYGGDFASEPATDRWSADTGQYSTPDTWQPPKELDYSHFDGVGDVSAAGGQVPAEIPAVVAPEVPAEATEEVPAAAAEVKVTEPAIIQSMPGVPILLDDTGAVLKCFYHPEADAVNSCSRCGQYVCSACNYVTGTHPICRNCWGKPAAKPIAAAPVRKQEIPKLTKSDKPVESPVLAEPSIPSIPSISTIPAIPEVPATPATPEIPAMPVTPEVPVTPATSEVPTVPAEPVVTTPAIPEITAVPAVPEVPAQQQVTPKLAKADKRKAEDDERFRQFMMLYEQAVPFISAVVTKSPDGLPASPLDLMEGLKLRPMLKHAKKLPKPREKGLQEAKKTFEQLLAACAKVGEIAADFVSSSGQKIPTEANFARLTDGVEKASGLMAQLSRKLPPPSQSQESL